MTKAFKVIEGSAARQTGQIITLTPERLERLINSKRERLEPEAMLIVPLELEYQQVLGSWCHFLGIRARETLLLRLAGCPVFYAPLFYELCDRASRDVKLRAWELAREAGNLNALDIIEEALGGDVPEREKGFWRGIYERLIGLAV